MSETATTKAAPDQESDAHSNRWKALVFIALAQLMVVLDATIVNIALPSAQPELGFSDEALHSIAKKAIERKTGARGLRSILEGILLDTMFDLPSMEGVDEVHIDKDVVMGTKEPVRVYAKKDKAGDAA